MKKNTKNGGSSGSYCCRGKTGVPVKLDVIYLLEVLEKNLESVRSVLKLKLIVISNLVVKIILYRLVFL